MYMCMHMDMSCACACACTCLRTQRPNFITFSLSLRFQFFTYQTSISSGELLALQWEIRRGSFPYLNVATWPLLAGGWPEIEWQGWPYGATLLFWEKVVYDLTHVFRMNQRHPQSRHTPHTGPACSWVRPGAPYRVLRVSVRERRVFGKARVVYEK